MSGGRLTALQVRLIQLLADMTPPWVLTGGAALAGFHLAHRPTRDLDLRWSDCMDLADASREVGERLRSAGLAFDVLQSSPTFGRLRVADAGEVVLIDLVADTAPTIEAPSVLQLGAAHIQVDTRHEILVNKLGALLGRMELRDLQDLRELMATGGDLERALTDAPIKDGGFSPLTLAWVLQGMPAARLAEASGWPAPEAQALDRFRLQLIDRLLTDSAPV